VYVLLLFPYFAFSIIVALLSWIHVWYR